MIITRRTWLGVAGIVAADPLLPAAAVDPLDQSAFIDLFAKRQTIRRYKSDPVPADHLRRILDAARRGPTCMNQQPWIFLVIQDRGRIEAMKKRTLDLLATRLDAHAEKDRDVKAADLAKQKAQAIAFTEGYFTAPAYVVVLVDSQSRCAGYALQHDGPIAAAYLMLAARAFGYGTAYLTDGIPEVVTREVLAIPSRYTRICITPIGIPERWPEPQPKRRLEEVVAYETLEGHPQLAPLPYNP